MNVVKRGGEEEGEGRGGGGGGTCRDETLADQEFDRASEIGEHSKTTANSRVVA